jgi:hypothetical protein
MTVTKTKREWWNGYIEPKQTKKDRRSIHLDTRDWYMRTCDMVLSISRRIRRLASNVAVKVSNKQAHPWRDKWPKE